jgi:hypothetical protein
LARIKSLPENYSKSKFNEKLKTMGTLFIMHNTDMSDKKVYYEPEFDIRVMIND